MDRIAVLIPCFNEERTIGKVVTDFKRTLPDAAVYVYDNNSNDRTAAVARDAGAIVRKETLQGKGNVIRRMFREVDAECYIMADGDDTYPADAAIEMVERVLEGQVDMVVGDRLSSTYFDENKRRFHNFGNALVRKSINKLFKCNIRDIMTGYRAFSYRFVKTFPVLSKGFEIETEMSIHAIDKNMNVSNVVVEYRDRPDGSSSKLNTFSDGAKVIRTIVSLFETYKPRSFFSGIALVLFLLAAVFFVPIFINYRKTGLVPNFPTLIVCGFTVIAGLQSFFSGIILHTLRKKDRQDFEMDLIRCQERYTELTKRNERN
ncbi:MAG: glycosyltransferase family 2 protein [Clostridia bacterium]